MNYKQDYQPLLESIANNVNPWLTIGSIFFLCFCAWKSLFGKVVSKEDKTGLEVVREYFRQRLLLIAILLHMLAAFILFLLSIVVEPSLNKMWYLNIIASSYIETLSMFWPHILVLLTASIFISYCWHRYTYPAIQKFIRKHTKRKSEDKLSDIRDEMDNVKSIEFKPSDYYKDGYFFFGLDDNHQPIYLDDKQFASRHSKILGPSQTGKGVGLGVLIDQAIRKGWGVWFNDIKPDDFIYHIMRQACLETGRELNYLDLNGTYGTYEPFKNGTLRQREERIKRACKINDGGTDADHYKSGNRQVLDFLLPKCDGSLTHLLDLLNGNGLNDNDYEFVIEKGSTLKERIQEFLKLEALQPSDNRTQFNIQELMNDGEVVYVKGNISDDLVRKANISLLDEFIQLGLGGQQKQQIFMVLDEVRFLVTDQLANSLATLLSKKINMAIAYQAKNDLANAPDKSLNVGSIMNGIETNTLITMSYRGHDEETAKWVAGMTGTRIKEITKMEGVELDRFGSEKWTGKKTYGQQEEYLIPTNRILSFNPRVGAFINGGDLACLIKTCWIPVKEFFTYPTESTPVFTTASTNINREVDLDDTASSEKKHEEKKQLNQEADELMKMMEQEL